ncbi:vWA domain-containing protein [Archangium primigenium]|uniref:vWA domain-containing protein n=1 Tax=[Archangium] primigenium TaxID=2792470 RepID=UPI00195EF3A4|nr:vWA domain-containing protein [Archangium primigenium]MBM7116385.1 VWA domain-containing protein [Archangium primigenium]
MKMSPLAWCAPWLGLVLLSACGMGGAPSRGDMGEGGVPPMSAPESPPGEVPRQPSAGQLTAGDWDDNLNFDFFQKYLQASTELGLRAPPVADRVVLTVRDEAGRPVSNARVQVTGGGQSRFEGPTASDGRVLFLPTHDGASAGEAFAVTVSPPAGREGAPITTAVEGGKAWDVTLPGVEAAPPTELDVAFVVDTTGSMTDELAYLKAEIQEIANTLGERFPQVAVRYGLVFYRDTGDDYVVRRFDFTSNVATLRLRLDAQSADGGGDYPEAMDRGLEEGVKLSWRTGNTARLLFLMADAPTHVDKHEAFLGTAGAARRAGIKVYPVAASGVSSVAEYQMRLAAQHTRGRYLFLTDDSGVGDAHEEPHIPCYQVQLLKHLLVRTIGSELEGRRLPVSGTELVRTVGNPTQDGACVMKDGSTTYY